MLPSFTSLPGRSGGMALGGAATLLWMFCLLVAFGPRFIYPYWTPHAAITLVVVPLGAMSLGVLIARGDKAAVAGLLFVLAAVSAGLAGVNPSVSIRGIPGRAMSAVTLGGLICVYAFGRRYGTRVRKQIGAVFLLALVPHLAIGVYQVAFGVDAGLLATFAGRAAGLTGNPVYFGALCAAGVAFATELVTSGETASPRWYVPLALSVFGVSLSGSRVALVSAAMVLVGILWRQRRAVIARAIAAAALGIGMSYALSLATGGRSAVERTVSGSGGGRSEVWRMGWQALLDRPVLGWGPGMFRPAIQQRFSPAFVRAFDPGGQQEWIDPHNLLVNVGVGTGVLGLALFLTFLVVAGLRSRGACAAAALAIGLTWLLQPMLLVTGPIAAFLLGASTLDPNPGSGSVGPASPRRALPPVLTAIGLLLAVSLASADRRVASAWAVEGPAELESHAEWLGKDPNVAAEVTQRYVLLAISDAERVDEAVRWSTALVTWQPERTRWWTERAYYALVLGEIDVAEESIDEALEREPTSADAWLYRSLLLEQKGDDEGAALARERLCVLAPQACDEDG